jgi:hypothetical protein
MALGVGRLDPAAALNAVFAFGLGFFFGEMARHMHLVQRRRCGRRAASSLRAPNRSIAVVTTAALPWRTGTSVNPMLRAAHLAARDRTHKVLLVVPWLAPDEQPALYPPGVVFATRDAQAAYIKEGLCVCVVCLVCVCVLCCCCARHAEMLDATLSARAQADDDGHAGCPFLPPSNSLTRAHTARAAAPLNQKNKHRGTQAHRPRRAV